MDNLNELQGTNESAIDLKFLMAVIRKCWYWTIIVAMIFALAMGLYAHFMIPKKYSVTITFYVDPNPLTGGTSYNYTAQEALAETYPSVLKYSHDFGTRVSQCMKEAKDEEGTLLFPEWIRRSDDQNMKNVLSMMTTGIREDRLFYITMTSTDPITAYYLAKFASTEAPYVLNDCVEMGTVKLLTTKFVVPTTPVSPSLRRNATLAAVVGGFLCFAAFFLHDMFDTTVYTESDLKKYNIPLLGMIPSFPVVDSKTGDVSASVPKKEGGEK